MTDYLYPNAVVYRINVGDEFYIGSTTDMYQRLASHKSFLKSGDVMKLYKKMRELELDFDDVEISILQPYPCNDIPDLRQREGVYQRELEPTLNTDIAGRSRQEWVDENKEHLQEYQKEWRENNKEKIKTKKSEKTECQYCKKLIRKYGLSRHYKICPNKPSSSS